MRNLQCFDLLENLIWAGGGVSDARAIIATTKYCSAWYDG